MDYNNYSHTVSIHPRGKPIAGRDVCVFQKIIEHVYFVEMYIFKSSPIKQFSDVIW